MKRPPTTDILAVLGAEEVTQVETPLEGCN